MNKDIVFTEVQRFRQVWLWALLLAVSLPLLGLFGYGMVKQLVLDQPWGSKPMSDTALLIVGSLTVLSGLGLPLLFFAMKMATVVGRTGISLRFLPFGKEEIAFADIAEAAARSYSAIGEYGGWGVRSGGKGKAYNVSGDRGVQLVLRNGTRLLIGSQRADELAGAIQPFLSEKE